MQNSTMQMSERENTLILKLISWDEREIFMVFSDPIFFSYKLGDIISDFYEILDHSQSLNVALENKYTKVPANHQYKLIQIHDVKKFPFIEIVAKSISVSKRNQIIGFAK